MAKGRLLEQFKDNNYPSKTDFVWRKMWCGIQQRPVLGLHNFGAFLAGFAVTCYADDTLVRLSSGMVNIHRYFDFDNIDVLDSKTVRSTKKIE